MRDLVPIAPLIDTDLVLVGAPVGAGQEPRRALALARAKPGTLNYGSSGPGSNYHMAGELLKNLTGIDIVHVPYKGSTGMRTDILSGQIQLLFDSVPTMAPLIKAGMVRALGTSGKMRSPILPDVPTIAEAGVPGFQATCGSASWRRRARRSRSSICSTATITDDPAAAGHQGRLGKTRRHAAGDDAAANSPPSCRPRS